MLPGYGFYLQSIDSTLSPQGNPVQGQTMFLLTPDPDEADLVGFSAEQLAALFAYWKAWRDCGLEGKAIIEEINRMAE